VKRTENYSTEYASVGYYKFLVNLRLEANKLLTEFEFSNQKKSQDDFKKVLSMLAKEMEPKYQRREDTEKPDVLEDRDDFDMSDVNINDCRSLLQSFRDLQEKLGITSMARNDYEMDEKGAVKKE